MTLFPHIQPDMVSVEMFDNQKDFLIKICEIEPSSASKLTLNSLFCHMQEIIDRFPQCNMIRLLSCPLKCH